MIQIRRYECRNVRVIRVNNVSELCLINKIKNVECCLEHHAASLFYSNKISAIIGLFLN